MTNYPNRFWHCRVKKSYQKRDATVKDLSFDELQAQIIAPYMSGRRFPVDGQVVSAADIDEIQIVHTPHDEKFNSERHHAHIRARNRGSSVVVLAVYGGPFSLEDATDHTHDLLFCEHPAQAAVNDVATVNLSTTDVFVVHGHDDALRAEVCRFLEKLGLTAVVLFEQADRGRTIIEKFEDHSNVGFAIVLVTPDDEGRVRGAKQWAARCRQNVIFELGFFYGKLGRKRVCALLRKDVESPSDISGVIYKAADSEGAWKLALAKEMKAAGFNIDLNRLA